MTTGTKTIIDKDHNKMHRARTSNVRYSGTINRVERHDEHRINQRGEQPTNQWNDHRADRRMDRWQKQRMEQRLDQREEHWNNRRADYNARGPEFRRGGYIPREYRNPSYFINDYRPYRLPRLRATTNGRK